MTSVKRCVGRTDEPVKRSVGSAEEGHGQLMMTYWLGIDVGTTFITVAICREDAGGHTPPEVVPLGGRSAELRSVVYLAHDGQVLVGEAAERRAAAEPDRVVRELKQYLGDEVPMLIGGVPHSAPELTALVVGWIADRVAQQEGGSARGVTLTHPASWAASRIQAMADALSALPLPKVTFCAEPQAVAAAYSMREWIDIGSTIVVYDLGGGTFDVAVLRKTGDKTFSPLGIPEGIGRLGGADFDDAVFGHVLAAVPALSELEPEAAEEGRLQRSFALCRRECTEAKEALSVGTEVTIPVLLPRIQSQVHLTRAEFEDLICPQVVETVEALRRTLRSADVAPEDLDAVLLVGGSSRMPLVAQLLSAELGRPVEVDPDPQAAIALGAAVSGLPAGSVCAVETGIATTSMQHESGLPVPTTVGVTSDAGFDVPKPATTQLPPWVSAAPPEAEAFDVEPRRSKSPRFTKYAAAGLLALVLAGGVVAVPLLTSHREPVSEPAAVTPAPPTPVRSVPVSQPPAPPPSIPVPQSPVAQTPVATVAAIPDPAADNDQNPRSEAPVGAAATVPAAPAEPAKSSRTATQHTGGNRAPSRPKPPAASTPPPPPPHVPDWVKSARSDP
jgi:molecular chaperone DnaK